MPRPTAPAPSGVVDDVEIVNIGVRVVEVAIENALGKLFAIVVVEVLPSVITPPLIVSCEVEAKVSTLR